MKPYINPTPEHISFRQGTWQFMAADLVQYPNIPQTFVHDFESFFWVLLWMVLTRLKTSWTAATVSSFIGGTMNPRVYSGTGGQQKTHFMQVYSLPDHFQIPGNPALRSVLAGLHSLLGARYRAPSSKAPGPYEKKMSEERYQQAVKEHNENLKELDNYDRMIFILQAKDDDKWPRDDGAKLQGIAPTSSFVCSSNSGTKRKREHVRNGIVEGSSLSKKR